MNIEQSSSFNQENDFESNKAKLYSQYKIIGTDYLAFRDLPELLKKYSNGRKTIDYGCGCGRSTRFLKSLGLEVVGVDTSKEMIRQAQCIDNHTTYSLIESAKIRAADNSFHIAFSSFVLFEISSKEEILKIFKEMRRILNKKGIFIFVTGSEHMYNTPWLTLDAKYKQNEFLFSGAVAKIRLKQINLELDDYFWTAADYNEIINKSGFQLLEKVSPLGSEEDGYPWVSEMDVAPYNIYILASH